MKVLKGLARALFGDYQIFRVLELERGALQEAEVGPRAWRLRRLRDAAEIAAAADSGIRALAAYAGEDAACFVAEQESEVVAVCWFWWGETYRRRNFWPLQEREAKLVQISTAEAYRNRGMAQDLIRYACAQMFEAGFVRLYARVWHSHAASLTAFLKSGWKQAALVVEIETLGRTVRLSKGRGGLEVTGKGR